MSEIRSILFGIVVASVFWIFQTPRDKYPIGVDYLIAVNAARGDYDWSARQGFDDGGRTRWMYPNWTAVVWKPLSGFSDKTGMTIWLFVIMAAYLHLVWMALRTRLGIALVLITLKQFLIVIANGNITPLLAWAVVTPFGVACAVLFKPYLLGFAFCHAIRREVDSWHSRADFRQRYDCLAATSRDDRKTPAMGSRYRLCRFNFCIPVRLALSSYAKIDGAMKEKEMRRLIARGEFYNSGME